MTTPLETHYRSAVRGLFERLDLPGLPLGGPVHGPRLEDVYVELQAVVEVPEGAEDFRAAESRLLQAREDRGDWSFERRREVDVLRYRCWREDARPENPRRSPRGVESLVERMQRPALVLLGDPGSGKSTLLRMLALRSTERLPILVPLAAYDECLREAPLPLEEFLAVYHARWRGLPGLGPLFQTALEEGRALVLLDGLDEVLPLETRRRVAGQVQALVKRWGEAGNRFVLTSRVIGYREARLAPDVPHTMVADFGRADVERFVNRWYLALERQATDAPLSDAAYERAREREYRLLGELRERPSLAHLTTHPLLLTMLAGMREDPEPIPSLRVDLYTRYADVLVDGWRRQRNAGARTRQPEEWAAGELHTRLMDVALWLHRHRPGGTASQADLVRALREGAELSEEQALRSLRELTELTGLLGERGRDAYGFVHLTFQEYFVGRALARLSPESRWALLRPHLHDPRWHEPLVSCAGQLGPLEGKPEQAEALVESLLANGSELEDVLHRDLFRVVAVLAEDIVLSEPLRDRLLSRLELPRHSTLPTLRRRALEGVVHLLRLGHAPAEQRVLEWFWPNLFESLEVLEECLPGVLPEALCATLAGLLAKAPEVAEHVTPYLTRRMERDPRLCHALCALLEDEDVNVRTEAVLLLEDWVGRDVRVGLALLEHLSDEEELIRVTIAHALEALVAGDARVRQTLLARLAEDTSRLVREAIVKTLCGVALTDEGVLQTLLDIDDESAAASGLCAVLGEHAASNARAKQALLRLLDSRHESVRSAARGVLGTHVRGDDPSPPRPSEAEAREELLSQLEDDDDSIRAEAISGLRTRAGSDMTVARALLLRLEDENDYVRGTASLILNEWAGREEEVRRALLAQLTHAAGEQRVDVVEALSQSARNDAEVRPVLLDLLGEEDEEVRKAVVIAVGDLAGSDARVRRALLSLLGDSASVVSRAAFEKLKLLAGEDASVRQALLGLLGGEDGWLSERVAEVLATVADLDEQVRRTLSDRLDEEQSPARVTWDARLDASRVLLNVQERPMRERALGWVVSALEHDDAQALAVRVKATTVLESLKPLYRDERVLERLLRLMREAREEYGREVAYHAVLRLLVAPVERTGNAASVQSS